MKAETKEATMPAPGIVEVIITERVIIDRFDVFPEDQSFDGVHPVIYAFRSLAEHLVNRPGSPADGEIEFTYGGMTYTVTTADLAR